MTASVLPRSVAPPRRPGFERGLAMRLAATEYARCADLMAGLEPRHWPVASGAVVASESPWTRSTSAGGSPDAGRAPAYLRPRCRSDELHATQQRANGRAASRSPAIGRPHRSQMP